MIYSFAEKPAIISVLIGHLLIISYGYPFLPCRQRYSMKNTDLLQMDPGVVSLKKGRQQRHMQSLQQIWYIETRMYSKCGETHRGSDCPATQRFKQQERARTSNSDHGSSKF